MAFAVADRVKETSTTTGTGTLNLGGAEPGYQTFVAGVGTGNTTYYAIVNRATSEFEVGIGTVTDAAPDTLSRDTIISSSNGGSAVNFSAGTKDVICTLPSEKSFVIDNSSNTTITSNLAVTGGATFTANVSLGDNDQLNFGASDDLQIYHDGGNNLIKGGAGTQSIVLKPGDSGGTILITNSSSQNIIAMQGSQAVLYYEGDARVTTTTGGATTNGTHSATTFSGSGASLTTLNASNVSSGTLDDARLTANVTLNNASTISAGTLADARLTANVTLNNASTISTGTLPNARLSAVPNSALENSAITINGTGVSLGGSINVGDIEGVTAGSGLTGGGTSGTVTLNVGAGNLIDVTADAIDVDLSELTTSTSDTDGDFFVVVDSANAQKKLTKGNINLSGFNNDSGFSTTTGTVTSVSGGNGLTGTVTTSGSLAVGAGTGIDVAADSISVDVSDFMSNGSNNRVLTATGTDAMNAEANMTFDGSTLAVTGAITATGDITAFFTSDETLKTNIENIQNPMDKVMELNGVYYDWTQEAKDKHSHLGDEKEIGVIAQQVEKVLPEIVGTRDDGTKAVRYERMCALLIECVKDLQNQVNELKKGN